MIGIFDIEANGLLDTISKIHCIVIKDYETGQVYRYRSDSENMGIEDGLDHLNACKTIVAHNGLDYDMRAIKKLYNKFNFKGKFIDTIILAKLVSGDLKESDMKLFKKGKLDGKLIGSHSLKAWGYRLGYLKGGYGDTADWSVLTDEMVDYCERDVEVTYRLLKKLEEEGYVEEVLESEQELQNICLEQTSFGFPFNRDKARQLEGTLLTRKAEIKEELIKMCGSGWYVNLGEVESKRTVKWKDVLKGDENKGSRWCKIELVHFNPNSRAHLAKVLVEKFGWKPTEYGKNSVATINEETLKTLKHPVVDLIQEYLMIEKRLGQLSTGLNAWLVLEREGKIHGRVDTIGAVTMRATHSYPNLAQIPANDAPYGKECRELFEPPKGWKLFGSDTSGLELRMLAHYMARYDGGAYGKLLLEGDIHTVNQQAAGLETRAAAKRMIYCYLYGGGDAKLGESIGGDATDGSRTRKALEKNVPALGQLIQDVSNRVNQGFIKGLDGRKVHIRHRHAALNTLLQSSGAIVCKYWVINIHRLLKERGYVVGKDYIQHAWIHDEVVISYSPRLTKEILEEVSRQAVTMVGDKLNCRIPLDISACSGDNYSEVH